MKEPIDLIEKIILNSISGSQLYGTTTLDSDIDYRGIFLPSKKYIYGLSRLIEESEKGTIINKDENNKNTKHAIDVKYFELKKFVNLASKCNPNILEMVFLNNESIIESSEEYETIRRNFDKFLSKIFIYERFREYAKAQRYKMIIKLDNYNLYKKFINRCNELISENESYKNELISILIERKLIDDMKVVSSNIEFADTHFLKSHTLYTCYKQINDRLSKVSNREELVLKYGYDTKFASHYIRLLLEGIELLETGKLEFPLKDTNTIVEIKLGNYPLDEILIMGENMENEFRISFERSKVNDYSDFDFLNNMTIKMFEDNYTKKGEKL